MPGLPRLGHWARQLSITALLAVTALTVSPTMADDADDLAEIARLQTRLQAKVPTNLRVLSADFDSGISLLLLGKNTLPQQASIHSGSDWVDLKPSGYTGKDCLDAGIPIAEFSAETGMHAYFKMRAIARELRAAAVTPGHIGFSHEGDQCEPGWRASLSVNDTRYVYLSFAVDGALAHVDQWEDGESSSLDAAAVRAMDTRASVGLPGPRVESEPLPAEAEIIGPLGDEYLVASIAGRAYVCAEDDIHFVYDYYSIDLRCEGDSTTDPLVISVAGVGPGKSEHRMIPTLAGPELWVRQGLVELESDDHLRDTRVWIDALDTQLIAGRFEGTVTNASGKRMKISSGRFRLIPGADFRVTRP